MNKGDVVQTNYSPSLTDGFVEVSKEDFYKAMGPLNVHPRIMSSFPYRSDWMVYPERVVGKSFLEILYPHTSHTRYFLPSATEGDNA